MAGVFFVLPALALLAQRPADERGEPSGSPVIEILEDDIRIE